MTGVDESTATRLRPKTAVGTASEPSRASRLGRPLLLLLGLVTLVVGYPVLVSVAGDYALYADGFVFVLVITSASVACLMAYRRGEAAERRFWLLLTAINVLTMISQTWAAAYLYRYAGAGPPMPSIGDALNLAAACCFIAFIAFVLRRGAWGRAAAVRHGIDALSLAGVLYAAFAITYVTPLFTTAALGSVPMIMTATAYPVVGVVIALGAGMGILSGAARRWTSWERLAALSFATYSVGLLLWPLFRVRADYIALNPWAIGFAEVFLVGHYLMFAAAVSRLSSDEQWIIRPSTVLRSSHHRNLAMAAPFVVLSSSLVLGYLAVEPHGGAQSDRIAGICAVGLAVLLALRSSVLVEENAHLRELAVADPLTRLFDRRQFLGSLSEQIATAQRYGDPVALIVMDLDNFASFNARAGSRAGDEALKSVARLLESTARPGDTAYRAGDDEFALLMPDTTAYVAMQTAALLHDSIRRLDTDAGHRLSASIGVAVFPEDALDGSDLLRRAESAGYFAKTHGKDQLVRYDPSSPFDHGPKERAERLHHESRLGTVQALAAAVDARDAATQFHSRNVARLAVLLAEDLGLSETHVELIETAALLHDIGKIGIADRILRKAGALTPSERAEVQQHATLSERILAGANLDEILPWILGHHERWDGSGYPGRLAGEAIPFEARLLAVCDAFDAMTSDRPYRSALSTPAALQEIDLNMGTQFDPLLAEAFIRVVGRNQPNSLLQRN